MKWKKTSNKWKKTSRVVIFADKTTNAYAVEKDAYNKLLREYITKDYKKADPVLLENINEEAKDITNNLNLSGRVQQYSKNVDL